MAAPIAATSRLTPGKGGRVDVGRDLTVEGKPGVYVAGDIANIQARRTSPQLGSVALQSGEWAAKNIRADRGRSGASRSTTSTRGRWRR